MKAITYTKYGPPEVLQVREIEKPTPGQNELLIKVFATAVNSTEPIDRKGEPLIARLFTGITGPKNLVLGNVLAGEVEAVGSEVKSYQKGDQVFGLSSGTHVEYATMAEDSLVAKKPVNMSYEEAAAVPDGALTALHFLRDRAQLQRGQSILINGASGAVGTIAVQLAKLFGATVTGVCSSSNMELVRSLGADKVIDYTAVDFAQTGERYDYIFDAVAKSSFSHCKDALTERGMYLSTVPTLDIMAQMLWTSRSKGKKAIFAASSFHFERADLEYLKGLIEAGTIRSVIDRRYPMEGIVDAHRYVEAGHKVGNVIITVREESDAH